MQGLDDRRNFRERRTSRQYRFFERRSGFDRRRPDPLFGPLRNENLLLAVLIAVNLLSIADWLFTLNALSHGAVEGNPILAGLLSQDPAMAAFAKMAATVLVTAGIWFGRRYRAILAVAVFALVGYVMLMGYHVAGIAAIRGW